MKRPDYKRAAKELMKILDEVEESNNVKENREIVDVTEETVGTVYQFIVFTKFPSINDN